MLSGPAQLTLGLGILQLAYGGFVMRKMPKLQLLIVILLTAGVVALAVYDVNCLSEGKCDTWAWIRTVAPYVIAIIAGLVGVNMSAYKL